MTTPAAAPEDDHPTAPVTIHGSVGGDVVGGDKTVTQTAGGDIVGGHKVTQSGTGNIFTGAGDVLVIQPQLSPASARDQANLRLLLGKVKTFWVEGVLERSVHHAGRLALGLELREGAVEHPWASVLELPDTGRRQLPPGTPIIQVFEDTNRALLILGEPGAGKTTTLLELARDLIARAEAEANGPANHPVPVVFNLSNWHVQRLPLEAWMAGELASKYQVPARIGRAWLNEQRILPLLDGLDEVAPAWQPACIQAINQFSQAHGLPGMAVCSRLEDYTRLPVRLRLNAAICLSPLSPAQISAYLAAGGDRLGALRAVMGSDDVLSVMARTPLLLSIMSLAYQDLPVAALTGPELNTVEKRRRHLFGRYVERMLKRKGQGARRHGDASLLRWTGWLARQMSAHSQTVFLVERLQPSWLSGAAARWVYAVATRTLEWWCLGFSLAAFLGIVFFTVLSADRDFYAMVAAAYVVPDALDYLRISFGVAGRFALMGLLAGLICGVRFEINARLGDPLPWQWLSGVRPLFNFVGGSVIPALIVFPLMWRASSTIFEGNLLARLMLLGLLCLPIIVLSAVAFRTWASGDSPSSDIPATDVLHWSWVQGLMGSLAGFHAGALVGAACMLTLALGAGRTDLITRMALGALPAGVIGAAAAGLAVGLRAKAIEGTPEAGRWLWRHARNVLAATLIASLTLGLFGALGMAAYRLLLLAGDALTPQTAGLSLGFGLACATLAGTVAAFDYGAVTLIRHVVLRLLLIAQRRIPWNLARIANEAEAVVFLRRVGGGYIFVHRLMLEFFATLDPRAVAGRPQSSPQAEKS